MLYRLIFRLEILNIMVTKICLRLNYNNRLPYYNIVRNWISYPSVSFKLSLFCSFRCWSSFASPNRRVPKEHLLRRTTVAWVWRHKFVYCGFFWIPRHTFSDRSSKPSTYHAVDLCGRILFFLEKLNGRECMNLNRDVSL